MVSLIKLVLPEINNQFLANFNLKLVISQTVIAYKRIHISNAV